MDSHRPGGVFEFRISTTLMMDLIRNAALPHHCADSELPDACRSAWRCTATHAARAKDQILQCATQIGSNWWCSTCGPEDTIWATNRFMIYALFPQPTSPSM